MCYIFFFNDTATTEIYTLSLHDALPILRYFGLPKVLWLQDPRWAMPALITMSLWGIGGAMLIYLAGLQGVPQQLYEAAELDGANFWHRFRHVTIPMLSPVIFFNLLMGLIGALQTFRSEERRVGK